MSQVNMEKLRTQMSVEQYERQKIETTQRELAKLLNSEEYKKFAAEKKL